VEGEERGREDSRDNAFTFLPRIKGKDYETVTEEARAFIHLGSKRR